ncbi:hypothetical protein [Bifidobacterium simiarum]|uniref:VG15 protein n=1 Tax=Bifidobacterium simiarum TaxID=2045441 RepID=UPI001BDC6F6A|nr:hypothetical protein [Bifidobacterium simiarum]MBT1166731.1 hypothetical protein [Bifidobacterium simiarum]
MADEESRTPDRGDADRLAKAQSSAVRRARSELRRTFETVYNLYDDPADIRDALLDLVPAIAAKYGDVGSVAAAEWYERMRRKWFDEDYEADTTYEPDDKAIRATVRRLAGHLWDGEDGTPADPDVMLRGLLANMDKWVKAGGRGVIEKAVRRDPRKPRFARVPQGAKTCAFCAMLAGRGFVYSSAEAAGAMNKFHPDCDCEIIPSWDKKNPKIEGYDDSKFKKRYMEARRMLEDKTVPEELMNGLLKIKPYLEPHHKKSWYGPEDPNNVNSIAYLMRHLHPDEYTDPILEAPDFLIKDGELSEAIGETNKEKLENLLRKTEHKDAAALFSKYSNLIRVGDTSLPPGVVAHFSPRTEKININLDGLDVARAGHPAFVDLIHECAHAIDWAKGGADGYFSAKIHQGRFFRILLSADARKALKEKRLALQSGTARERDNKALQELFNEVSGKLDGYDDYSIHDLFQAGLGYDGGKYKWPSTFGHKPGYFKTAGKQETEAFAEMMAAQLAYDKSWLIMEEYFPNATKMFVQIVKDMLDD